MLGIVFICSGIIVCCNVQFDVLFGIESGVQIGQFVWVWYGLDEILENMLSEVYVMLWVGECYQWEWQLLWVDGICFWCEFSGVVIDVQDLSKGMVWMLYDIMDCKVVECELLEECSWLLQILENSLVGVLINFDGG